MSSVNSASALSFITSSGGSNVGVTSKIEAIQEKIKEALKQMKEIAESDMDEKAKQELIQMKQQMIHLCQSQITMIQNQAMQQAQQEAIKEAQEAVKDQLGTGAGLATQKAAVAEAVKADPSAISHIGEKEEAGTGGKKAADGLEVAGKKEDDQKDENEPELRGPRRPISEYI